MFESEGEILFVRIKRRAKLDECSKRILEAGRGACKGAYKHERAELIHDNRAG